MPTINQLVRKPRQTANKKSKSPALGRIQNTLKVRYYDQDAPLKRGVCVKVILTGARPLTSFANSPAGRACMPLGAVIVTFCDVI